MSESEWYRAEAEQTEVFAPLIPVERVWAEEYGLAIASAPSEDIMSRLVSLDEPARRVPIPVRDANHVTGRRVVQLTEDGEERRDLRAVTELHTSTDGDICVRVCNELDWYRWGWSGRTPRTLEVPIHLVWIE